MQAFNVNVGRDGITLSFCVREPGSMLTSDTRIVDARATLSKGTLAEREIIVSCKVVRENRAQRDNRGMNTKCLPRSSFDPRQTRQGTVGFNIN
jgi:hypothetical protein